ncbi:ATP-dependent helicase/DNAse subunit B [Planifilum fimeticola]|uniref:ATP-dependent helicase/DNAse subunit B n=1 Tax=Planifilum fimeticola TaxID=201975 RepID=A0A2T0LJ43_9BACL|nr:ATP-dependent helicase/DNAse subunit B [Planifilum fimeticola]
MPGVIHLYPVSRLSWGMGWPFGLPGGEEEMVYLVPSSRVASEMRWRLGGFSRLAHRVRIFTFDQFVMHCLAEEPLHRMSPAEQELIVQQAVLRAADRGGFSYFQEMVNQEGWLQKVETWIGMMKRGGIRPERLTALWRNRGAKWEELARIYEAYHELLEQCGLMDHEEPYFRLMGEIARRRVQLPERVVAEHFYDLSPLQEQLLIQLVTADVPTELHLVWDASRERLFGETRRTVERLSRRGFAVRPAEIEGPDPWDKKAAPLCHLTGCAFSRDPETADADGTVEVIAAPGIRREVEAVVARIKRWLEESGGSLSEAAIVSADPEMYLPELFRALDEAGLPCSRSRTRPLSDHPLFRTIRAALLVRMGRKGMILHLLRSPYIPWGDRRSRGEWAARLRRLGMQDGASGLRKRLEQMAGEDKESPSPMLELLEWVEAIPLDVPWAERIAWFREWIRRIEPAAKGSELEGDPELLPLLAEDLHAFRQLDSIAQEWEALYGRIGAGRQRSDLPSFVAALTAAAERKPVRSRPGVRGGLQVLEPNQVRGDRYRAVFLLGCTEGVWPRPIREDWLLSDEEVNRLRDEAVLLPTTDERRKRQLTSFFLCTAAAEELLVLSWTKGDGEGRERLPSPYVEELLRVFTRKSIRWREMDASSLLPDDWTECFSLRLGMERAVDLLSRMSPAEEGDREDGEKARRLLQRCVTADGALRPRVGRIRAERIRWGKGFTAYDGVLGDGRLRDRLRRQLGERVWSASQLNELSLCRFHFFAGRLLGLGEREKPEDGLTPLERGELLHRILCRFWDGYRDRAPSPEEAETALRRLESVTDAVFREAVDSLPAERHPLHLRVEKIRLKRQLRTILEHEFYWRGRTEGKGTLLPRYLELSFGMPLDPGLLQRGESDPESRTEPVEISLDGGVCLRLRGKVDRVDVDDEGYYVVYDYKSGTAPRTEEVHAGIHLQLPLYLWALQKGFGFPAEKAVGAAYYVPGSPGKRPTENRNQGLWRKSQAKRAGILDSVRSALDEEAWTETLDAIGERLSAGLRLSLQGNFAVQPAVECPVHCPHRTICRFDPRRSAQKEENGRGSADG